MKRSELIFSSILVPIDYIMIVLAGITAYYIRFAEFTTDIRPAIFDLPFLDYFQILLWVAFSWIIIFAFLGLYNIRGTKKIVREFYRVVSACSTGFMMIVVLIFMQRELFDSRFIVLAGWILAIFYISLSRLIIRLIQRALFRKGVGIHNVVLIGNSKTADILMQEFSSNKSLGYKVIKRLRDFKLETSQELLEYMKTRSVDEIIQSDPNLGKAEILHLFEFADENHVTLKYAADLLGTKVLKTEVVEVFGVPIVEVKKTPLDGWGRIAKRTADMLASLFLLILLSPVFLITALVIKIDSRGPVFYLDFRTGQFGKRFLFYKFRSMVADLCDGEGPSATDAGNKALNKLVSDSKTNTRTSDPLHKIKDDPRVTKIGKFIRRWSLDELPQLFNVLKGDISMVGPRPHMTIETALYESRHKKVFAIKPGITGIAQISGRSDLGFDEEVKLDTYYIENWSMLLDLSILLRTPWAVLRRRKVE
jgi:exopolysaccharide biosynthesis polyprenyl glycosylphosphotransferase